MRGEGRSQETRYDGVWAGTRQRGGEKPANFCSSPCFLSSLAPKGEAGTLAQEAAGWGEGDMGWGAAERWAGLHLAAPRSKWLDHSGKCKCVGC